MTGHVDRMVAPAALGRAVLLGRAAATLTATVAGLRLVADPRPLLAVLAIVVLSTGTGLVVISRNPYVVGHPLLLIAIDTLLVVAVLVVGHGGVAYFCCAVGASALAGVLIGLRALVPAAIHAAVGYLVAGVLLRDGPASPDLAGFVLTFPMANVLAAAGAAVTTAALGRYVELSVEVVASAQRSAAASERARLARELHDSVTKTLRGVSFAALALPSSLRRHPALAEQLAGTVSQGAAAAAQEARDLLDGLRLDSPDRDFAATLDDIGRQWSLTSGVPVRIELDDDGVPDPPVETRYELCRILQEALRNTARHAGAGQVVVSLGHTRRQLRLRIHDDGRGFDMPPDPARLRAGNHYGIIGMAERADTLNGTLRITAKPGAGTAIEVSIPLHHPARSTS